MTRTLAAVDWRVADVSGPTRVGPNRILPREDPPSASATVQTEEKREPQEMDKGGESPTGTVDQAQRPSRDPRQPDKRGPQSTLERDLIDWRDTLHESPRSTLHRRARCSRPTACGEA